MSIKGILTQAKALSKERETTNRLRKLLRKVVEESFLDVEEQKWQWSCNQKEFEELTRELKENDTNIVQT